MSGYIVSILARSSDRALLAPGYAPVQAASFQSSPGRLTGRYRRFGEYLIAT